MNPQGVVGDGCQVAFPIADQQLRGSWGGGKGTSGWDHPRTLAQERGSSWGPRWHIKTHSPWEEHFNQQMQTLDLQAVAERGIPCSVHGHAGVEAGVCHLGLGQPEGS